VASTTGRWANTQLVPLSSLREPLPMEASERLNPQWEIEGFIYPKLYRALWRNPCTGGLWRFRCNGGLWRNPVPMAAYGESPFIWRPMANPRSNGGLRRILVVLRPMANPRLVAAYGELPYNGGLWRNAVQRRPKANLRLTPRPMANRTAQNGGLWRIPGLTPGITNERL
jgi:hypothetical protein